MSTPSLLNLPATQSGIKQMVTSFVERALDGEQPVLVFEKTRKALEAFIETLKKNPDYKRAVWREANAYPEKTFSFEGAQMTKGCKPTFDYSVCNDSEWNARKAAFDKAKERLTEREDFLKSLKEPIFIQSTGEEVYPPAVSSTEYLSITLPK